MIEVLSSDQLGFLFYDARSGSTLLARHLHASPDIAVTPESRVFCNLILYGYDVCRSAGEVDAMLDVVFREAKFESWGVSRQALRKSLEASGYPFTAGQLVLAAADLYRCRVKPGASLVLVKHGDHLFYLDRIRQLIPPARLVHIVRDGRDVFLSKRASTHSETGAPMMDSLVQAAWMWRAYAASYLSDGDVIRVRYEDLIAEPKAVVATVLASLSARSGSENDAGGYADLIPAAQRHLHGNVRKPAIADNLERWRSGLAPAESVLYQLIAGRWLRDAGYRRDERNLSWSDGGQLVCLCFREFRLVVLRKLRRLTEPGLVERLRKARELY